MKKSLGQILSERGAVTQEQLAQAIELQKQHPSRTLGDLLVESGAVTDEERTRALAEQFGYDYVPADEYQLPELLVETMPLKFLREHRVLPIGNRDEALLVAIHDPADHHTMDAARLAFGQRLRFCLSAEADLERGLEHVEHAADSSMNRIIEDLKGEEAVFLEETDEDVDHLKDLASEAPVIRLVNLLVTRAVERRASDIHIENFRDGLKVRYRIDGVLQEVESPPRRFHKAIVSRVKILAKLNIAERRLPQDGQIGLRVLGRDIEFRVATTPTVHGENVVVRILDKASLRLGLDELGFPKEQLANYLRLIRVPHGLILVTGPTGSGKSTTLYTSLLYLNSPKKKIITIEDPVEQRLEGVNQIQVNPKINLTFANGLRSILRMDPDIIMVGEIRDPETAEIAVQSALTGHLVFSTLHTNDASGAIARLTQMGVPNYLVASALIGVIAQRLVRVTCNTCRQPYQVSALEVSDLAPGLKGQLTLHAGKGCDVCAHTGFFDRTAIFEVLMADDEIRSLILADADTNTIKKKAIERGMHTLRQDAWAKIAAGITTPEEARQVVAEQE